MLDDAAALIKAAKEIGAKIRALVNADPRKRRGVALAYGVEPDAFKPIFSGQNTKQFATDHREANLQHAMTTAFAGGAKELAATEESAVLCLR